MSFVLLSFLLSVVSAVSVVGDTLPTEVNVGAFDRRSGKWLGGEKVQSVAWAAPLGDTTYGTPVICGDRIFVATNNKGGYDPQHPPSEDRGVLLAFDRHTGERLWQYSAAKLEDQTIDWPEQGICSSPCVEGERLWLTNNRGEIVAIDTRDGRVLWAFDLIGKLGVVPHCMTSSSPIIVGSLVISGTSNGISGDHRSVPSPTAPSLVALDKETGEIVWSDASPVDAILDGQWSSPAWNVASETLFFGAGDGFLYGFSKTGERRFRLDGNLPGSVWHHDGRGDKNTIVATPVIADGKLFLPMGQDPESGEGPAVLWCYDLQANTTPQLCWKYCGRDTTSANPAFEDRFHRTIANVVVADGLVLACDFSGVIHCLDAATGELFWTHDAMGSIWGGALAADGKFFVGTACGELLIIEQSRTFKLVATVDLGAPIYTSPATDGNTLFVATSRYLFALKNTVTKP